jgi:allantoicase
MDEQLLPDLLRLRGSVVAASDEFFAAKENLIKPTAPIFVPDTYGAKGQVYDGWETRRRRGPGGTLPERSARDWVIVRLGVPGVVHSIVVDTSFFIGNYPQACSADACSVSGYPSFAEIAADTEATTWQEIVPRVLVTGDARHTFSVNAGRRFTHIRLNIFPDGGVARLHVHGEVVPDPALLEGLTFDLAALENGADLAASSDQNSFSAPRNLISPGLSRVMGEGWETRRRRRPGHEWLVIRLAGRGVIDLAEIDTSWYRGNQPDTASLQTLDAAPGASISHYSAWRDLLPPVPLLPDTPHRFRVTGSPATHVRLNIFPDGGVARLRLYGSLTDDGLAAVRRRWEETALYRRVASPETGGAER